MEFVEYADETHRCVLNTNRYWVETDIGNMIDTMCGNSAYIWGYNHPDLNQAVKQQFESVQFLRGRNSEVNETVLAVNQQLLAMSGMSGIIWAVSGSDAVEAGLELAHQYWQRKDSNRTKTVSFVPGYHGCTYLAKSLWGARSNANVINLDAPIWNTDQDKAAAEIKTLKELDRVLTQDKTVGSVIFETVPWIAGIRPYSTSWWLSVRSLCDTHGVLMIADDVWGGFGKVGTAFSHTLHDVYPDIVVMGKSITGGYVPSSCALSNKRVSDVINDHAWVHGHTWQPQMLGIALTRQVLNMFDFEQVLDIDTKQIAMIDRLGLSYRGTGLTKEIMVNKKLARRDFERAGLCNTQYTDNSIFLVTPFCADEEYWAELEQRITTLL
jgi:adenosylmethionine-8-amino-7-oxononanoate aminotransferase